MGVNSPTTARVLFVCTGNTCRSVFAEYISRQVFVSSVVFESAGIRPQPAADAENAAFMLKRNFNIDASGHVPRDVGSLDLTAYTVIIALEKSVAAHLVEELGAPTSKVKLWKISDPWGGDLSDYDRTSLEIMGEILKLKASGQGGAKA
jgi:protein-tyrosine-phosphatase